MALRWLALSGMAALAAAQAPAGCLSLSGSTACPGYSSQSINPSALAGNYSFLAGVTSVAAFDSAVANYVNGQYRTLKYNTQLGCTNTSSAYTLQYATTVLCSVFTQASYRAGCVDNSIVNRMACQSTCLQYATSENFLVANPTACGTTNTAGATRQQTLTYDFTTCTDWTSLISNNTATCVLGQNNEGNCGFGGNTAQLCDYCNPSLRNGYQVDSCCGGSNTNLGTCGYTLNAAQIAASPTPSSTSSLPTGTASAGAGVGSGSDNTGAVTGGSSGLSKGAIAGIVIGSVVGALLLLALVLFLCARRRRANNSGVRAHRGSGGRALLGGSGPVVDQEKGGMTEAKKAPSEASSGNGKGALFAAGGKKFTDSPPSPSSTGTPGGFGSSSDPGFLSGKSSPTSSFGLSGPIAGISAATVIGAGALAGSKRASDGSNQDRPVSQGTANTGSSNERNLVASVRDQYSSAEITPGTDVVAIYAYTPNLPDELKLEPDAIVTVKKIYDDGWAVGTMQSASGSVTEGAFPLVVCTVVGATSDDAVSTGSSTNSSHRAVTAREGAPSSGSHLPRSSTSGRTSSIGGTSFESAQSQTSTGRSGNRSGFFAGLRRR